MNYAFSSDEVSYIIPEKLITDLIQFAALLNQNRQLPQKMETLKYMLVVWILL